MSDEGAGGESRCRGYPEGKQCPKPVHYVALALCKRCYEARRLTLKRAEQARQRAEAEAPPGVPVTPENPHPKYCPLCGHGLTAAQYRKTPEVQYDKHEHPARLKRELMADKTRASIAKRFGITEAILDTWIEKFPDMQAAVDAAETEDALLLEAAFVKALGDKDPQTGEYQGGDPGLLKMFLQDRHGFKDREPPIEEDPHEKLEKQVPIVLKLLKRLEDFADEPKEEGKPPGEGLPPDDDNERKH